MIISSPTMKCHNSSYSLACMIITLLKYNLTLHNVLNFFSKKVCQCTRSTLLVLVTEQYPLYEYTLIWMTTTF